MSTTHEHPDHSTDALVDDYLAGMPELDRESARVAVGLWRQLAEGLPVERDDLGIRLGLARQGVDAALDGPLVGTYLADDEGRVRAFWALSLSDQPTPHRLLLDDRRLYAWCAVDTLFLPLLLGRSLVVESTLTTTEEPITLEIHPDRLGEVHGPDDTAVSFVPMAAEGLGDTAPSIMSTYCHHMLFFPSVEAGRRWAAERGRDDLVIAPLREAFDGCQRLFRSLLGDALADG
jgi:alkylmercury lyase